MCSKCSETAGNEKQMNEKLSFPCLGKKSNEDANILVPTKTK